ncbi:MAG: hypothetical protein UY18_C0017G0002 [Microgenomates group bacterium GW2011_GWF2_47_9]|nr:MAG: hypothetical protein UY18_C0017G0002 [Microgenomates group bacterium GW2011_GWF2_47_9]
MSKPLTAAEKAAKKAEKDAAKAPKLAGSSALNVVNRDGQIVRTYTEQQSNERCTFVEAAEEFVAKNNKNGADYKIEKA